MKSCLSLVLSLSWSTPLVHGDEAIPSRQHTSKYMTNSWILQSADNNYAIQTSSSISRHPGGKSYRFELRKGDVWISQYSAEPSFRAEINTDDFVSINSVQWYGFSMFLPNDFPIEDNRLVLGQWWARSKTWMGEVSKSPPISQNFRSGVFRIRVRHSSDRILKDTDAPTNTVFEAKNFPLGKWNDFVYQVKWSYKRDGFINIWFNGKQVARYRGPVGYNDDIGPKFKFGIYRDASDQTQIAYFDEVRRGKSYAEVDPAALR